MNLKSIDPSKIKPNAKDFRILQLSNAFFCPSGYGNQSMQLLDWNKYYDVRQLANYGLEGVMLQLNGLAIYPILFQDSSGANTAKVIFPVFKPNVFITLYDIWMGAYTPQDHTRPTGLSSIHPHWIPIVMVDHDPIPENTLRSAGEAYKIITPTQFGVKEFERQGLGHKTYYLPFGIDTTLFKPTIDKTPHVEELIKKTVPFNKMNALEWKKDDIFLIGTNGANKDPYRKAFDRMFIATQIFLQQNPDAIKDTRFYVHSWMRMARDIPHLAKALGIDHICRAPTDYHMLQSVPLESMASMYNSLDLYLHLSQGGGFEIPILEAMTSGVPVIGNDFVGMTELVKDHGWLCKAIEHREMIGDNERVVDRSRYFTPLDATVQMADAWEAAKAIEDAYNNPDKAEAFGKAGRVFSLDFDWSIVNGMWYNLFEQIREEQAYKPLEARRL